MIRTQNARRTFGFTIAFALAVALSGSQAAGQKPKPKNGPVVKAYGPVYPVLDPDFETPTDLEYKAVFDVAAAPHEADAVNPSIETIARFLNMHAQAGVPPNRLHAAIVLHGAAGKDALGHAAYRERFGTDNPSLELMEALAASGVRILLCGQTAGSRGFERAELAEPVELALSAMTALVVLQEQGYRLIDF